MATQTAPGESQAQATPICELVSVTKVYESSRASIGPVSLSIARGEFFSLLGPSGCGKSTTLRMIAGLEQVTSGEIRINGRDVTDQPPNKRPTNMVFQQLALFPHLNVAENVAFGLRLQRLASAEVNRRVGEALDLVQLGTYERRRVNQLSGGQQQRVAVARALVMRPAVLLLDEPLAALDVRLRQSMQVALKEIQRGSQTTFLFVTHDQAEAFAMSDRVGIMNEGHLLQVGSPEEIYHSPRNAFTARFVGDTNLIPGAVEGGQFRAADFTLPVRRPGAHLAIRPENVRVGPQVQALDGVVLEARVMDATFLGPIVRYRLALPSGQALTVTSDNGQSEGYRAQPGEAVRVSWRAADCVVLDD